MQSRELRPRQGGPRRPSLAFDGNGNVSHRYLHGPQVDRLFADESAVDGVLWALSDRQGSVRDWAEYDSGTNDTSVFNHVEFDSYGNIESQSNGSHSVSIGYTGRYYDAATGLQWNRARWYDPSTGRWMNQDPIGFAAGDANLYRYVGNGPTNASDPSGLMPNRRELYQLSDLIESIRQFERNNPAMTPTEVLNAWSEWYKGWWRDDRPMPEWSYFCTEQDGYLDLPHFIIHAADANNPAIGPGPALAAGSIYEAASDLLGTFTGMEGFSSSKDTPEDAISNELGVNFGSSFRPDIPLSDQLEQFFLPRGLIIPRNAPFYSELPADEAEWNLTFENDADRKDRIWQCVENAAQQPPSRRPAMPDQRLLPGQWGIAD